MAASIEHNSTRNTTASNGQKVGGHSAATSIPAAAVPSKKKPAIETESPDAEGTIVTKKKGRAAPPPPSVNETRLGRAAVPPPPVGNKDSPHRRGRAAPPSPPQGSHDEGARRQNGRNAAGKNDKKKS